MSSHVQLALKSVALNGKCSYGFPSDRFDAKLYGDGLKSLYWLHRGTSSIQFGDTLDSFRT